MSNIREQKGTIPCMIGTIKIKQKKCYFCVFIIFCFGRRNYNSLKYFISLHKTEACDKKNKTSHQKCYISGKTSFY